ncbi:N-succinylarginine dihydrolase, partial [Pseudomonas aeruginosa]|uniref:N-succinylarginine dihydrolase n=1 Tax=Pseudomonas aeruginosa TaxID=287 RepID=UPI003CC64B8E
FHHEDAFHDTEKVLAELHDKLGRRGGRFRAICEPRDQVAVEDAVKSYLFYSHLLSMSDGSMLLVVPEECRINARVLFY